MSFKKNCRFLLAVFLLLAAVATMPFGANAASLSVSVSVSVAQCADGLDNDGDGLIDYPADPGCDSAVDNDETDSVPPPAETQTIIVGAGGYSAPPSKPSLPVKILKMCDFNSDNRCNIIDFSILLFYMNKPISVASRYDLNNDGTINIVDISILFYHWA